MACADIMRFAATTLRLSEHATETLNHFTNIGNIMRILDSDQFPPLKIESVRCMRQLVYEADSCKLINQYFPNMLSIIADELLSHRKDANSYLQQELIILLKYLIIGYTS